MTEQEKSRLNMEVLDAALTIKTTLEALQRSFPTQIFQTDVETQQLKGKAFYKVRIRAFDNFPKPTVAK